MIYIKKKKINFKSNNVAVNERKDESGNLTDRKGLKNTVVGRNHRLPNTRLRRLTRGNEFEKEVTPAMSIVVASSPIEGRHCPTVTATQCHMQKLTRKLGLFAALTNRPLLNLL